MADHNTTDRRPNVPPAVGRAVSVRVLDEDVYDDLAVLMRPGGTASDAIRAAVHQLANAYRRAWEVGDVPDGTAPHIISIRYALPDGTPEGMPHPAHTAFPHVRDVPTTAR